MVDGCEKGVRRWERLPEKKIGVARTVASQCKDVDEVI